MRQTPVIVGVSCARGAQPVDVAIYEGATDTSQPLWLVRASENRLLVEAPLGQTPRGFREVVPLSQPLDPAKEYQAQVTWGSWDRDRMTFTVEDLPADGQLLTAEEGVRPEQEWIAGREKVECEVIDLPGGPLAAPGGLWETQGKPNVRTSR
jgi:hypothetical protein